MEPPEVGPHPGQLATLIAASIHGTRTALFMDVYDPVVAATQFTA
jgi:hypothetical protein